MSCSLQNLSYLASLLPRTAPTETGEIVLLSSGVGDNKIPWSFTRYLLFWVMQKEDRNSCCFYAMLQISRNVKTVISFFLVARNFFFVCNISKSTVFLNWHLLLASASLSGSDWNIFTLTMCTVLATLVGLHVSQRVFSLITNLVTLRKLAEWLQSCVSHRSHNIITALQNLIARLSLCTSSTVECNLIFYSILSHTLSVFVKWGKTLTIHPETCLIIFYICCPISVDRLQDEIPVDLIGTY